MLLRLHLGSPSRHSFQLSMGYCDLVLGPGTYTLTAVRIGIAVNVEVAPS